MSDFDKKGVEQIDKAKNKADGGFDFTLPSVSSTPPVFLRGPFLITSAVYFPEFNLNKFPWHKSGNPECKRHMPLIYWLFK